MNKCPNCGSSGNIDRNLFCHNCGIHLRFDKETGSYAVNQVACGECGQLNASNVNFCSKCGISLKNEIISYGPETNRKSPFGLKNLHSRFVAVGIALLLGVGLTWFLYSGASISSGPRIDVVFCIDTTGSMGDEIDVIKRELNNMINNIRNGNPKPSVRFGIVAFRDRGDNYVVKEYKLTDDVRKIKDAIDSLKAEGGGDFEESLNEALHVAVQEINWDKSSNVSKMIFLIGDAGPHMDYTNDYNYKKEIDIAKSKHISINTIGCSGMDTAGTNVFSEIASNTNGGFDYLTYRQTCVNGSGGEEVVLYQGGRKYVVNDAYRDDSSWKDAGAMNFAGEEKARSLGETDSPSMGAVKGDLENNLDRVVTQSVQKEAVKQGVTY